MTIDIVAGALGVSTATVSRAITGNGRISPNTRKRVLDYMKAHNYYPNSTAQNLANLRTMNIAFIVPGTREFSDAPFFLQCLIGVGKAARANEYDVLVVDSDDAEQTMRLVERRKVDGVILSRGLEHDPAEEYLKAKGFPFVVVGSKSDKNVYQVDHDHYAACRQLTLDLAERWDGRFGLIAGDREFNVNKSRADGFIAALRENGDDNPAVRHINISAPAVKSALKQLYRLGVRNFICGDDAVCSFLSEILKGNGVYEQTRVASFYGSDQSGGFDGVLPYIKYDADALGQKAGEVLINVLKNGQAAKKTLVGYEICAC